MSNRIEIDSDQLINLYKQNYSQQKIAKILGCSKSTISIRLREINGKDYESPKPKPKEEVKKFSPAIREILMETYL